MLPCTVLLDQDAAPSLAGLRDVSPLHGAPRRLGEFEEAPWFHTTHYPGTHLITARSRFLALRLKLCLAFLPIATSNCRRWGAFRDDRLAITGRTAVVVARPCCMYAQIRRIDVLLVRWLCFTCKRFVWFQNKPDKLTSLELNARPSPLQVFPAPDRHIGSNRRSCWAASSQRFLAGRPPSSGYHLGTRL